jgi:hypothetical protein
MGDQLSEARAALLERVAANEAHSRRTSATDTHTHTNGYHNGNSNSNGNGNGNGSSSSGSGSDSEDPIQSRLYTNNFADSSVSHFYRVTYLLTNLPLTSITKGR